MKLNENVIKPLGRRIGSIGAGALIALLSITDPETAQAIKVLGAAFGMVAVDLYMSWKGR
ncbi:hypothetical protein ACFE33_15860 (plasmid) [Falsihalocynthiibacter sp. SS001]|uniref:hypothetical protein n=1 Tax=Falsihalocynthiibacter sp. SS001 TaxID=3349698 RepID=UPI0036D29F53